MDLKKHTKNMMCLLDTWVDINEVELTYMYQTSFSYIYKPSDTYR